MRFTSISSSIASVVCRVIGFVAGSAVRTSLHLTHMREHMLLDLGYWLKPCQPRFTNSQGTSYLSRFENLTSGKYTHVLRLLGIAAPAACLAPVAAASAGRLASVRKQRLG